MNIALINQTDTKGGAAQIAWTLFEGYRRKEHRAWYVVGHKKSADPDVFELARPRAGRFYHLFNKMARSTNRAPFVGMY